MISLVESAQYSFPRAKSWVASAFSILVDQSAVKCYSFDPYADFFTSWGKTMIKFTGIHHLAMVTADMDRTIRFWRDLLGMRLVAGLGKPGYRHYFFEISPHDLLAFFEWSGAEPVKEKDHGYPVAGPVIFDHVSFGVESVHDLWELKNRLELAGFWASEIIDHGFIHSLYSFDPNGIPIEFSHCVKGVDIRKEPTMVDRSPSAATREGPEPSLDWWPISEKGEFEEDRQVYPGEGLELLRADKNIWLK